MFVRLVLVLCRDIRNHQLLQHYSAHDSAVSAIDFHPSGNYLLSSSVDSSIRLWDLRQGHQLYTIHGHPSPVHSCAFNAAGDAFVTGGGDQRVITWNSNLEQQDATGVRKNGGTDFGAPLPRVGVSDEQASGSGSATKRGAMLAAQVARPVHGGSTGQMLRNGVEPGRRDAYYAAHGLTSGPVAQPAGRIAAPQPSGPLPPTEMGPGRSPSPSPSSAAGGLDGSQRRRVPPSYTFRTGEHAGKVIGGGHLYVDASAPSAPPAEGEGCCDYRHSHISSTSGDVHSYLDVHDESLLAESAQRAAIQAARYPGGPPGIENQPLEDQMLGFAVPGLTSLTETGRASTRAGIPGPSPPPPEADLELLQQQPDTARSQLSAGVPSFAAASAGVQQSNLVQASVSRRGGSGPSSRQKDEFVYSLQSDRFVPAAAHPNQAKTSEAVALKNTPGVDIFAIPPADHIQRLPEQLAHTLKYMTTQLDQITRVSRDGQGGDWKLMRATAAICEVCMSLFSLCVFFFFCFVLSADSFQALNVFEYRMNVYEQKVDRLDQQQARWTAADGF